MQTNSNLAKRRDGKPFNFLKNGIFTKTEPLKISDAEQTWFLGVNVPTAELDQEKQSVTFLIGILFTIIPIALVVSIYMIIRSVIAQINKGVDAMKNISHGDGDLTVRMEVYGEDEISQMFTHFNNTIQKIHTAVSQVKNGSDTMIQLGETLSDSMNDTAAAANEITANIESVKRQVIKQNDNVKESSDSVEKIYDSITDLSDGIKNQSSSVMEASSAIEEMVANIRSVTNILLKNSDTIEQLEKSAEAGRKEIAQSAEETTKITKQSRSLLEASKVIQTIASQTNLLAMNAAIEAAHAGSAGAGFSVVADEIRKLAEDSNKQGKVITANLKTVISSIHEMAESSKILQQKFNEIYSLTQEVAKQELTIKSAMEEQSEGGGQVLGAMKQISEITDNVKTGSDEIQLASETVAERMGSLMRITDEITSSMQEMSIGIESINSSMNACNDLSHKTSDAIMSVSQSMAKFKV